MGDTPINKATLPEWPYDVNTFIRFPDSEICTIEVMKSLLAIPRIKTEYPEYFITVQNEIEKSKTDSNLKNFLAQPDPYFSSAVINQPLWQASQLFERDLVITIYLRAISNLKSASSYSHLVSQILIEARPYPAIAVTWLHNSNYED